MCPLGCECTSNDRHSVICDGASLFDIPSLLDPRTKRLSLSNCNIRKLDADILELYAGKLISFIFMADYIKNRNTICNPFDMH